MKVIAFDVLLVYMSLLFKNVFLVLASIYFSIIVSYPLFKLINDVLWMRKKDSRGLCATKFHSAEHMAVNAYNDLHRVPTIEEIKRYSCFSKICGSRNILAFLFRTILVTIAIGFIFNWSPLVFSLLYIFITIFSEVGRKKGWLQSLQVFVTEKPSDLELEVAIMGLRQFEELESLLEDDNPVIEYVIENE